MSRLNAELILIAYSKIVFSDGWQTNLAKILKVNTTDFTLGRKKTESACTHSFFLPPFSQKVQALLLPLFGELSYQRIEVRYYGHDSS